MDQQAMIGPSDRCAYLCTIAPLCTQKPVCTQAHKQVIYIDIYRNINTKSSPSAVPPWHGPCGWKTHCPWPLDFDLQCISMLHILYPPPAPPNPHTTTVPTEVCTYYVCVHLPTAEREALHLGANCFVDVAADLFWILWCGTPYRSVVTGHSGLGVGIHN